MRISLKLATRLLKTGKAHAAYPPFHEDKRRNIYIRVKRTDVNRVDWYKPNIRAIRGKIAKRGESS